MNGDTRRTQAQRRASTRAALLEAAARGLSARGYTALTLEQVASDAGCSRGALYHQFSGKEELALEVVRWIDETWEAEVGGPAEAHDDPVDVLLALARHHAEYCRRDVARVMTVLHSEFSGRDHPVGRAVDNVVADLLARCTAHVEAARARGSLPPGPSARDTADAFIAVVEAVGTAFAGRAPADVEHMDRAVRGPLGLAPREGWPETNRCVCL